MWYNQDIGAHNTPQKITEGHMAQCVLQAYPSTKQANVVRAGEKAVGYFAGIYMIKCHNSGFLRISDRGPQSSPQH